jgi:hypothetical protein
MSITVVKYVNGEKQCSNKLDAISISGDDIILGDDKIPIIDTFMIINLPTDEVRLECIQKYTVYSVYGICNITYEMIKHPQMRYFEIRSNEYFTRCCVMKDSVECAFNKYHNESIASFCDKLGDGLMKKGYGPIC